jgi:hypothetical protein
LAIIKDDRQETRGIGLDQTNMAIGVLAETEREDFHGDLLFKETTGIHRGKAQSVPVTHIGAVRMCHGIHEFSREQFFEGIGLLVVIDVHVIPSRSCIADA